MNRIIYFSLLLQFCGLYFTLHLKSGQRCYDGRICKFTKDCPGVLDKLDTEAFPIVCGFDGLKPIVCCPGTENETSSNDNAPASMTPNPVDGGDGGGDGIFFQDYNFRLNSARKMCKTYIAVACNGTLSKGADVVSSRLPQLDEVVTEPIRYPFAALIGYKEYKKTEWRCGGSLISDQYILSAAKCAVTNWGEARWVRLGELDIQNKTDSKYIDYDIIKRFVHPSYQKGFVQHDIALFKLRFKIPFSDFIRPTCLDVGADLNTAIVVSTGWGMDACPVGNCPSETYANTSHMLTKISPFPVTNEACNLTFGNRSEWGVGIVNNATFCTSNLQTYRRNCQGVAGDPVVFLNENSGCPLTYSQFGVLSTTEHWLVEDGCNYVHSTTVYTQVSNYVKWIEGIVGWRT